MKVKFYNSLIFRLTVSFVLLITIITGFTYAYTYNQAKKALKDTVKDQLDNIAEMSAQQLTPEQITLLNTIQAGDDANPKLAELNAKLYDIRKNIEDINELYIMRKEDNKVIFIADDWLFSKKGQEDDPTMVGDEYTDYEETLLVAFTGQPSVSKDFYTDQWGTWLTGYAPIKNQANEVVAVLGADMDVSVVQAKINFINSLVYYIIGIAILAAGLIILFFSITITKHLSKLTVVANKFSAGNLDVKLPEIKTKNEIFFLVEGIKSLKIAIDFLKEKIK